MKIERIVMVNQPDIHNQLNKNRERNKKKKSRRGKENLSFSDYVEMMKHDSYKRVNGRLRQR